MCNLLRSGRVSLVAAAVSLVTLAAGCGDDSAAAAVVSTEEVQADLGDTVTSNEDGAPSDAGLTLGALTVDKNPNSTISCFVSFTTNAPTAAWVEVWNGETAILRITDPEQLAAHRILVIGMRAETTYTLHVHARTLDGLSDVSEAVDFTTGALPPEVVLPIVVTRPEFDSQRPWTYVGLIDMNLMGLRPTAVTMVDGDGQPVWYQIGAIPGMFFEKAGNSDNLFVASPMPYEVTLSGDVAWLNPTLMPKGSSWGQNATVADNDIHHDMHALENGNLAVLRYDVRGDLFGDRVQEIARDGSVVWEWLSLDHIPHGMATGDVHHGNALTIDHAGGWALYSCAVEDIVVKIDLATGNILWRLGRNGDFVLDTPDHAIDWFARQHAPTILPNGHVMLFDNSGEFHRSHVREYELIPETHTAKQVWQWPPQGANVDFWTDRMGSAYPLPNGNVIIGGSLFHDAVLTGAHVWEVNRAGDIVRQFDFPMPMVMYRVTAGLPGNIELLGHDPFTEK